MTAVAEGVLTSRSAHALAQRLGVEAPIIEGIYRVIHEGADPVAVVTEVMRCAAAYSESTGRHLMCVRPTSRAAAAPAMGPPSQSPWSPRSCGALPGTPSNSIGAGNNLHLLRHT